MISPWINSRYCCRKERATVVRSITGYSQSYNYNKIYERYKQVDNPTELSQDEYDRLIVAVRATPKESIVAPTISCLDKTFCENITAVLSESPVFTAIESLQQNASLRNWVQRGYEMHKESGSRICEFCHSPISSGRWSDLENYFNDSLSKFKSHIELTLEKINSSKAQYSNYISQLPHPTQFFDECADEYSELKIRAEKFCNTTITFLDKVAELVQEKSDKIIDTQCSLTFSELLSAFDFDNSVVDEINALIQKHNQKAEDFRKSISSDEQKLELHIIAQSVPQFSVYERNLSTNSDNQRATIDKIKGIVNEIQELDKRAKNSRIPAEIINSDIGFIFGHSDLHFEWKENGYEIRRGEEIATYLSTGEQNAIALIYFFNSLQDSDISKDRSIVILDDPVSSFDSNYYYSAVAYIRDKLQSIGQAFILTHKFSLYKDFSRMFSDCHHYLLERPMILRSHQL